MSLENRREFYRARIALSVKWEILGPEERSLLEKGLGRTLFKQTAFPSPIDEFLKTLSPGSKEEQLYRCFQLLNNKLDFIIDYLLYESGAGARSRGDAMEISGSGLKFFTEEPLEVGNLLKMSLVMPGTFQYQMEFIAEIVRMEEKGEGHIVAANILEIDEETRDAIIKVVFQKQRMEIRQEKGAREEGDDR